MVYGGVWVLPSLTHFSFWYYNLILIIRNNSKSPSRTEKNQGALSGNLSLPIDRMWYCFWLFLFWVPPTHLSPSSCELCLRTTQTKDAITRTLLFHNNYSCAGIVIGSCFHNGTTYSVCSHGYQHTCFDPVYDPSEEWLEVLHTRVPLITQHGSLTSIGQYQSSLMLVWQLATIMMPMSLGVQPFHG
jgi:hypothetical protein